MKTEGIKRALMEDVLLENKKGDQNRTGRADEFSKHVFEAMKCENISSYNKSEEAVNITHASNLGEVLINAETIKDIRDTEGLTMNENDFSIIEESLNHIEQFVSELNKPKPDIGIIKSIFNSSNEGLLSTPELQELMEEMKIAAYTEYIKWKRGDYL